MKTLPTIEMLHEQDQRLAERNLLVAVLNSALLDYFAPLDTTDVVHSNRAKLEAASWLFDDELGDAPFSFAWVCDGLDISPSALRERVLELSKAFREGKIANPLREKRVFNYLKAA